jgi:hypothetical protein
MKRSAIALGASALVLALGAGPAQADPEATQSVADTTGAAQVGAVAVNAPVRVASDGDSQSAGVTTAAPQTTTDSTGGTQVSSVGANAPVRVLSDGDDDSGSAGAAASGGSGDQSTGDSRASAQVGSPAANAPVRVASDGDNTSSGDPAGASAPQQSTGDSSGAAQVGSPAFAAPVRVASDGDTTTDDGPAASGGQQTAGDSSGAAQVGSPRLFAPIRVFSGGQAPDEGDTGSGAGGDVDELIGELEAALMGGDQPGGDDTVGRVASVGGGPARGRTWPSPDEIRRLADGSDPDPIPVFNLQSGGAPTDGGAGSEVGDVSALGAAGGDLPLTGAGVVALIGLGLSLLSGGAGLRRIP